MYLPSWFLSFPLKVSISLDVEYIDGTKIESKANKYTCLAQDSRTEPYETNG